MRGCGEPPSLRPTGELEDSVQRRVTTVMDGYHVGRTLREMPDFEQVLLVALTGYGQEDDRRKSE